MAAASARADATRSPSRPSRSTAIAASPSDGRLRTAVTKRPNRTTRRITIAMARLLSIGTRREATARTSSAPRPGWRPRSRPGGRSAGSRVAGGALRRPTLSRSSSGSSVAADDQARVRRDMDIERPPAARRPPEHRPEAERAVTLAAGPSGARFGLAPAGGIGAGSVASDGSGVTSWTAAAVKASASRRSVSAERGQYRSRWATSAEPPGRCTTPPPAAVDDHAALADRNRDRPGRHSAAPPAGDERVARSPRR